MIPDGSRLPRQFRSKVNIAMISALNRLHELTLHIKSAFNTGVTRDQIMEILAQVACYARACLPASTAFASPAKPSPGMETK